MGGVADVVAVVVAVEDDGGVMGVRGVRGGGDVMGVVVVEDIGMDKGVGGVRSVEGVGGGGGVEGGAMSNPQPAALGHRFEDRTSLRAWRSSSSAIAR